MLENAFTPKFSFCPLTQDSRHFTVKLYGNMGFACRSDRKESTCSAGDPGSFPGLGRSPGEGNGNPL